MKYYHRNPYKWVARDHTSQRYLTRYKLVRKMPQTDSLSSGGCSATTTSALSFDSEQNIGHSNCPTANKQCPTHRCRTLCYKESSHSTVNRSSSYKNSTPKLRRSDTFRLSFGNSRLSRNSLRSFVRGQYFRSRSYCTQSRNMAVESYQNPAISYNRSNTHASSFSPKQHGTHIKIPLSKKVTVVTRYAIRKVQLRTTPAQLVSHLYKKRVYKAVRCLNYRRHPVCIFYARTGKCNSAKSCRYLHDPQYLRICPKFLNHSCPLGSSACPLAHVFDPCRLPVCEYFESSGCNRKHCPYLHIAYPANTPACIDFLRGRCSRGRSCKRRHAWTSKCFRKSAAHVQVAKIPQSQCVTSDTTASFVRNYLPEGSLRYTFPAPNYIPLLEEDSME